MTLPDPRPPKTLKIQHPETAIFTAGFDPALSVMSARPPVYRSSTFLFHSAEEGERFFELALGKTDLKPGEQLGLIYSCLNNPNAEMFEDRFRELERGARAVAVFTTGMAAIATSLLTLLAPGDVVLFTAPVYGGTDHVLNHILSRFGIRAVPVVAGDHAALAAAAREHAGKLALIYLETPANPTLRQSDIKATCELARTLGKRPVRVFVDNTFLGPLFQSPLELGADLVLYSATKYIGGHSDLVAGVAAAADEELLASIRAYRSFLGTIADADTSWLLGRSIETIHLRMNKQSKNAERIAHHLAKHGKVERVLYPTVASADFDAEQRRIYESQCRYPGGIVTIDIKGGKPAAFRFLNALKIAHLAVSLGGVETLVTHPLTTTHSELDKDSLKRARITEGMVRLSIGVENWHDILGDFEQALAEA